MKTVTGKILSSSLIPVSKAAKIITNFAATDNGALQAISAYLRRTSASFIDLKQLHRELQKQTRLDHKHKKSKSETTVEGAQESRLEPSVFNVELSQESSQRYGDGERKKHKKKKDKGDGGKMVTDLSKVKKHNEEKNSRNIENLEENGMNIEKGETGEGEKKRKCSDIVEGIENIVSSEPRKKKKKIKKCSLEAIFSSAVWILIIL